MTSAAIIGSCQSRRNKVTLQFEMKLHSPDWGQRLKAGGFMLEKR